MRRGRDRDPWKRPRRTKGGRFMRALWGTARLVIAASCFTAAAAETGAGVVYLLVMNQTRNGYGLLAAAAAFTAGGVLFLILKGPK